jgi:uncharacterized repeat protein (TIGR01451 family)
MTVFPNTFAAAVRGSACRWACLAMIGAAALFASVAQAQIINTFDARATFDEQGDIAAIGNVLITCQPGGTPDCAAVQNGTSTGNNNRTTQYVNIDPGAGFTNSSSANLNLPAGAQVLFAGLYWGGRADPASTTRGTIRFRAPGSGTYATITATTLDTITVAGAATTRPYEAFADVTTQVQAAGNGTYFVGELTASTGNDGLGFYGGWGLVVIYRDTTQPFRRLTVFDGAANVSGTSPVAVTVTGLLTPATGAFTTRMGAVVWEGDQGITGDNFTLNGTPLADGLNLATNFWNSSITRLGTRISTKNPDYVNQLALDIDYVDASGILANSATTATLQFGTNGDTYFPHALFFAVDLFVPDLVSSLSKTTTDLNGAPAALGETLEYTVSFNNSGQDGASRVVVTDPIPAGTTYVPGSLQIVTNASGAPTGPMTDAAGDDQAEFLTGPNRVVFRLGQGATTLDGGIVPPAQGASMRFRVTVDNTFALNGQTLTNTATVTHASQTLGDAFTRSGVASSSVSLVARADLSVSKTNTPANGPDDLPDDSLLSASSTVYQIVVTNNGPSLADGALLTDPLPTGLTCTTATCTASGGASCPAPTGAALLAALQGAGAVVPVLPVNGSVAIALTCTVN